MAERMMQFFQFHHLRTELHGVCRPYCEHAEWLIEHLPSNPERTIALRKLLESRDAAIRAALYQEPRQEPAP